MALSAYFLALALAAPLKMKPRRQLQRIRRRYIFVDVRSISRSRTSPPPFLPKVRRSTKRCPWQYDYPKPNPNQIPSTLVEAKCPKCPHFCIPVMYTTHVLVKKRKDKKTRDEIWRLEKRRVTVSYKYDP